MERLEADQLKETIKQAKRPDLPEETTQVAERPVMERLEADLPE